VPDRLTRVVVAAALVVAVARSVRVEVRPVTGWGPSLTVWVGRTAYVRYPWWLRRLLG
jgi:hypothetical protein